MTRAVKYTAADVRELTGSQQHMMADIADSINASVEMGQLTPAQALEALERLVVILKRKVKK